MALKEISGDGPEPKRLLLLANHLARLKLYLGPFMFLIYINYIASNLDNATYIRLFADDFFLYRVINSSEDNEVLQKDLTYLYEWSCKWQMGVNVSKCKTLRITTERSITSSLFGCRNNPQLKIHLFRQHLRNSYQSQLPKMYMKTASSLAPYPTGTGSLHPSLIKSPLKASKLDYVMFSIYVQCIYDHVL